MRWPLMDWKLALVRLALMAGLLLIGIAVVRHGTDVLQGIAFGVQPAAVPAQPSR